MSKRLIIVDVSSFIFRAYFAIPPLNSPEGTPINAVHGVLNMMLKLFSTYQPTHLFIAKDTSGGTFRNEMYSEYKANRPEAPEDLVPQFALIKELIEKMDLPNLAHENFEADDIIGSAVEQWKDEFEEILIATGDKDLMQLVGKNVKMVNTMRNKFSKGKGDTIYDEKAVFEKMGVRPDQIVDYLAMVGDKSDNVPGMRGIGAKGAAKLLEEHGTLEKCIEVKETFKGKKLTTAFTEFLDDALLSQKLVTVVKDIDLGATPDELKYKFYPSDELLEFLRRLGFKSSVVKLESMKKAEFDAVETDATDSFKDVAIVPELSFTHKKIETDNDFGTLIEFIESQTAISMFVKYDSDDIMAKQIVSINVAGDSKTSFHLNFAGEKSLSPKQLKTILDVTWGRDSLEVCSDDIKSDITYCMREGRGFLAQRFDVNQVHYIINTGRRHAVSNMVKGYFDFELLEVSKKEPFEEITLDQQTEYCGQRSCCIFALSEIFKQELKEKELESIYYEIDDLMITTLAKVELNGMMINPAYFEEFEEELTSLTNDISTEIHSHYEGDEINLNSPKQLGELLFDKLGLPHGKKTKTGYSTNVEVLEQLVEKDLHPVPALMMKYRELTKLNSTYVKPIPALVNPISNKLHTTFNQTVAETGRLSSLHPNLQNIPIRTELGRRVRKGFIAEPGKLLLGADYSQVELRLLAHFSGDEVMVNAFKNDQDIHRQTAAEILDLDLGSVTSADRSKAKAVNFGLMYGQSSFGLAAQLKISRTEAKHYIVNYFERFSGVKRYLDSLKEECHKTGYAITMMGRKRYLPDIRSSNRTIKAMAERVAINSPIQGTAADIIKLAMIDIDRKLVEGKFSSKMLLQVHDELIFEVPEDEVKELSKLVKDSMENIVKLKIPLKVDMGMGVNWLDLK